jgi:hypothetical protein
LSPSTTSITATAIGARPAASRFVLQAAPPEEVSLDTIIAEKAGSVMDGPYALSMCSTSALRLGLIASRKF